jgi:hypothetical protein
LITTYHICSQPAGKNRSGQFAVAVVHDRRLVEKQNSEVIDRRYKKTKLTHHRENVSGHYSFRAAFAL